MENALLCFFDPPTWFIFSENAPLLLYYSHIPVIFISVFVGTYVLIHNRESLPALALFFITSLFSFWLVLDLVQWSTNKSDLLIFSWSLAILVEVLIYAVGYYMVYTFFYGKDMPFRQKIILGAILLPFLLIIPTKYSLWGVYLADCVAAESLLIVFYSYALEILFVLLIAMKGIEKLSDKASNKRVGMAYFLAGIILFLAALSYGNIFGSITDNWELAQLGIFGMPLFIGLLTYSIMRSQTFDAKLFGAQVLIGFMWVLVGSLLFLNDVSVMRIVVAATSIVLVPMGILFVRSVRQEIEARREIEKLAARLRDFISFATHELRGPIGNFKSAVDMIIRGDFGEASEDVRDVLKNVYVEAEGMAQTVDTFLSINKIEAGGFVLDKSENNLISAVTSATDGLRYKSEKKHVTVLTNLPKAPVMLSFDFFKIQHVVKNVLDNALKYTPEGGRIDIGFLDEEKTVTVFVKDTGIGMEKETLEKLFQRYERGRKGSAVAGMIEGHGIGLWLSKQIVDLHGGNLHADSEGEGHGSTFYITLPKAA